jgi:hypothetical protein
MTTTFYAQPYDIAASGFYFDSEESYLAKIGTIRNDYGQPVEEFEIQFIDGDAMDCAFAKAWGLNQANILRFMEAADEWDDDEKRSFIIAVGECGYSFDPATVEPSDYDVTLYEVDTLAELAMQFVDESFYGDIPEHLSFYIDYAAMARDLAFDYTMIEIAGERWAYHCP